MNPDEQVLREVVLEHAERQERLRERVQRLRQASLDDKIAISVLVAACKFARELCPHPRSIVANELEKAIRVVEPSWQPPPSSVGSR